MTDIYAGRYKRTVKPPNNPCIITSNKAEKVNFFNQRSLSLKYTMMDKIKVINPTTVAIILCPCS